MYAGRWFTAQQAAIAHDRLVLQLKLDKPLNLPAVSRKEGPASAEQLRREARLVSRARSGVPGTYLGVSWNQRYRRWTAQVRIDGRPVVLGRFADPADAARARDAVVLHLHRVGRLARRPPLNLLERTLRPLSPAQARALAVKLHKRTKSSRYRGVHFDDAKPNRPWVARSRHGLLLGRYRTERDAAVACDRAALHFAGDAAPLHFPRRAAALGPADAATLRAEAFHDFKTTTHSRFRGVALTKAGRWYAVLHHDKQRHYLGVFDTEEEAAVAYDTAALRLKEKRLRLNFHPDTGAELCGEWVTVHERRRRRRRV